MEKISVSAWIDIYITDEEGRVTKHCKKLDHEGSTDYFLGCQVRAEIGYAEAKHKSEL